MVWREQAKYKLIFNTPDYTPSLKPSLIHKIYICLCQSKIKEINKSTHNSITIKCFCMGLPWHEHGYNMRFFCVNTPNTRYHFIVSIGNWYFRNLHEQSHKNTYQISSKHVKFIAMKTPKSNSSMQHKVTAQTVLIEEKCIICEICKFIYAWNWTIMKHLFTSPVCTVSTTITAIYINLWSKVLKVDIYIYI